jgi:hypothetical protein
MARTKKRKVLIVCGLQNPTSYSRNVARKVYGDTDCVFTTVGLEGQCNTDVSKVGWVRSCDLKDKKFDLIILEYCPIYARCSIATPLLFKQLSHLLTELGMLVLPIRTDKRLCYVSHRDKCKSIPSRHIDSTIEVPVVGGNQRSAVLSKQSLENIFDELLRQKPPKHITK